MTDDDSLAFGAHPRFELFPRQRRLTADRVDVPLGGRALDVLLALMARDGQCASRRELIEAVWPDDDVLEINLSVQISALRRLLGRQTIATVPGRGYAFTPTIERRSPSAPRSAVAPAAERFDAQLPCMLTPLIGREDDLRRLDDLLRTHRLLTLLGTGGIGKTLTAQHMLRRHDERFRHGVCFVDLTALSDEAALPGAVAGALRVHVGGGEPQQALAQALMPLHTLIVLDGAEHLTAGVARLVTALLDRAPQLHVIVTSQAPLKLSREQVHRLEPLAIPEPDVTARQALGYGAIALFVARAQAADSLFELSDEGVASVVALCRALDGVPLAIELAAWRAPLLGVQRLAESMRDRLPLLAVELRDAPSRRKSLRGALEWSHALLGVNEQVVLWRLAVLAGSADLDLVRDIVPDGPAPGPINAWVTLDALTTLAERSLLTIVRGGRQPRYRLLDTPKAFALELLVASGEEAALRQRHAAAVVRRAQRAMADRYEGKLGVVEWRQRYEPDRSDADQALEWLRGSGDAQGMLALLPALIELTPREECSRGLALTRLVEQGVAAVGDGERSLMALLAAAARANLTQRGVGFVPAQRAVLMARSLAGQLPDARWLYLALCQRALALFIDGQSGEAQASLFELRALEDLQWPEWLRAKRWLIEIWHADRQGDGAAMDSASRHCALLEQRAGFPRWRCELHLVNGAMAVGRHDEAARLCLSIIEQLEGTRQQAALVDARIQLVFALVARGDLEQARHHSLAAWPLAKPLGRLGPWTDGQVLRAAAERRQAEAARLLGFSNRCHAQGTHERAHNEALAVQQAQAVLHQALGTAAFEQLQREGAALSEADLPALAFAARGPA